MKLTTEQKIKTTLQDILPKYAVENKLVKSMSRILEKKPKSILKILFTAVPSTHHKMPVPYKTI